MINLQDIADKLGFDVEDVEMVLEAFMESARDGLETMKKGIDSGDFEAIFKSAHGIKGSSANLTLDDISSLAKEIEMEAREKLEIDYEQKYKFLKEKIDSLMD